MNRLYADGKLIDEVPDDEDEEQLETNCKNCGAAFMRYDMKCQYCGSARKWKGEKKWTQDGRKRWKH